MKHFAVLDENNVVVNVVAVDDEACSTDEDVSGETYCVNLLGPGIYKQFSHTGAFRKQGAQKQGSYDPVNNVFIDKQKFPSWTLDDNHDWQAPVAYPNVTSWGESDDVYPITWDEDNQRWLGTSREGQESLVWDGSAWSVI